MKNNIAEFYDEYSSDQIKTGINDRIASMYRRMLKAGVTSGSRILELGCGIGMLSGIILKKIKPAYLESVDLSPKSIEIIQKKHGSLKNFTAVAADVVHYIPQKKGFDIITLFDVIEHIPLEHHPSLFKNLSKIMADDTKLLINVPAPLYLKYIRETQPELLQIIDQEIYLDLIIKNLTENNLMLSFYETYGIWSKNEYQFMIIEKRKDYEAADLKYPICFFEKVRRKLLRIYLKN